MAKRTGRKEEKKDFFISYNSVDKNLAEWIAWTLEEAGYTTVIQAWDFLAGMQFPVMMQKAAVEAERTIAVLSRAYLNALFTQPEWAAAFAGDPAGEEGKLIPVRAEDFDPPGIFRSMIYIDLVGLQEEEAQKLLLEEIKTRVEDRRRKPKKKPGFSPVPKKNPGSKPGFEMIPLTFHPLDLGRTDEMVGREDAVAWLEDRLFERSSGVAALSSLQGAGGMGKTFLAHAFAEKFGGKAHFLPLNLEIRPVWDKATAIRQGFSKSWANLKRPWYSWGKWK